MPTPAELKLWRESNRFTRKKKALTAEEAEEPANKKTESFEEMLTSPSTRRGEARRGAKSGKAEDKSSTLTKTLPHNAPTPTLPLRGREKSPSPLTPLKSREAARFLKAYPEIEAMLDLHGLTKLEAYAKVQHFIARQHRAGRRHLLIITGKGRVGEGVLRRELPHWLNEPALRSMIAAFAIGRPEKGGNGVTHVLVKQHRER